MFLPDHYPDYLFGMAYLIPAKWTPCLFQKGLDTKYLHIEDAFVTGLVRTKCGLRLRNSAKFYFSNKVCDIDKDSDMVIHGISLEKAHNFVTGKNHTC